MLKIFYYLDLYYYLQVATLKQFLSSSWFYFTVEVLKTILHRKYQNEKDAQFPRVPTVNQDANKFGE